MKKNKIAEKYQKIEYVIGDLTEERHTKQHCNLLN